MRAYNQHHIARVASTMDDTYYDSIIVGGGPAGLTALIYLARSGRRAAVLHAVDSRCATIKKSVNHSGFDHHISGVDLLQRIEKQAISFGGTVIAAQVLRIEQLTPRDGHVQGQGQEQQQVLAPRFRIHATAHTALPPSPSAADMLFAEAEDDEQAIGQSEPTPLAAFRQSRTPAAAAALGPPFSSAASAASAGSPASATSWPSLAAATPHALFASARAAPLFFTCRTVLLATGVRDVEPLVPGLPRYPIAAGLCAVSPLASALECAGQRVAILGDGPVAAAVARAVRPFTKHITVFTAVQGAHHHSGRHAQEQAAAPPAPPSTLPTASTGDVQDRSFPGGAFPLLSSPPSALYTKWLREHCTVVEEPVAWVRISDSHEDTEDGIASQQRAAGQDGHGQGVPLPLTADDALSLTGVQRGVAALALAPAAHDGRAEVGQAVTVSQEGQQYQQHLQQPHRHHHYSHSQDVAPSSHFAYYLDVHPQPQAQAHQDLYQQRQTQTPLAAPLPSNSPEHPQQHAVSPRSAFTADSPPTPSPAADAVPAPRFTLITASGMQVAADALYSGLGVQPRCGLAASLGAALTPEHRVAVNHFDMSSSVPGLYAAGDITPGLAQMGTACGQGAVAAAAMHAFMAEEEEEEEEGQDGRGGGGRRMAMLPEQTLWS